MPGQAEAGRGGGSRYSVLHANHRAPRERVSKSELDKEDESLTIAVNGSLLLDYTL